MTPPSVSGVLLAGGASRRFGADKLVAQLDGAPLFHHALRSLAAVCDEVVIVIAPDESELSTPSELSGIRFARDPVPHEGPLLGVRTGLRAAAGSIAIVAAADMVRLRPALLSTLRERLEGSGRRAVALADADGLHPLPVAMDVAVALAEAEGLVARGERRLRALVGALAPETIAESEWSRVDPAGEWRIDVDAPEDLPRRPRS